ncbi:glycosyltransferase [Sinomonas cellulolyticus]|uniref:glycosyltransferase n=1 Tax=Sinomonas cellulolyticus TaxID=2801916 RepID=UPI001E454949|nr:MULTISPECIES: glycosyltransferase [Sinomonas]
MLARSVISEVVVVVPAKDEEDLLPACLESVLRAARVLAEEAPAVGVGVTLLLDGCTDGSAGVAARWPQVRAVHAEAGGAGAARRLAVEHALVQAASRAERVWIATTDADSRVPRDWLVEHLALAESGVGLVLGTVEPDPADLDAERLAAWHAAHRLADGHGHVFGANLGVRADAYLAAGGFPVRSSGEDTALALAVKALGVRWRATDGCRVVTSGRLRGRARGGFADYLTASAPLPSA